MSDIRNLIENEIIDFNEIQGDINSLIKKRPNDVELIYKQIQLQFYIEFLKQMLEIISLDKVFSTRKWLEEKIEEIKQNVLRKIMLILDDHYIKLDKKDLLEKISIEFIIFKQNLIRKIERDSIKNLDDQ